MCYTCIHCGHCEKSFDKFPDDTPGKCVACNHQNASIADICEKCGAPLLKTPYSEPASLRYPCR